MMLWEYEKGKKTKETFGIVFLWKIDFNLNMFHSIFVEDVRISDFYSFGMC